MILQIRRDIVVHPSSGQTNVMHLDKSLAYSNIIVLKLNDLQSISKA